MKPSPLRQAELLCLVHNSHDGRVVHATIPPSGGRSTLPWVFGNRFRRQGER